ncbi:hypothetical protein D0437_30180 [Bacillus cereus]|uniref:Uncharacterized protein n=1 Tax=Bacillus cereus TaxID=1396 RepID=A0A9X7M1E7_BACCE|nr:hypothetical protein D0437_30180 [Bacillus cereus]
MRLINMFLFQNISIHCNIVKAVNKPFRSSETLFFFISLIYSFLEPKASVSLIKTRQNKGGEQLGFF